MSSRLIPLFLLATLAASPTAVPAATPKPQILRIGNGAEPEDLDPQTVTGVTEDKIIKALFEGLLTPDPKDLHPCPGVAETWDTSPDGLTYTFHLRANARWSNGDPVTAQDFVASYRRMLTPKFGAEYANFLFAYVVGAKDYFEGKTTDFSSVGFAAPDARTLQVKLLNPTPYLLKLIATHYAWDAVPISVVAQSGPTDQKGTGWTKPGKLVGNGPFILREWVPNKIIVVARNPDYWDAANVKLDGIEFYPIVDQNTEEQSFRTGQLDVTSSIPPSKIDVYRRDHSESFHLDPYLGLYFYSCNVTKPPLTDKRVRRALALTIDREAIVKSITKANERPAYAVSYPDDSGYTSLAQLPGGQSPAAKAAADAEARRLMAEAGYPGGKGCPPIELLYNTLATHRSVAEAIQQMWKVKLGVEVRLTNQEWKVYLESEHTKNYQMVRSGWIADYTDPQALLELWGSDNGNNDTMWSNPEYDRLLKSALAAPTEADRYALYQKMDALLVDECPIIPIFYYTHVYALSPKVKGWYPTLLDIHPYKYVSLEP